MQIDTTNFELFRPQDCKELFNLPHAQAHNVIEQIFGVVKCRFHIMVAAPEYDLPTQTKLVPAICILHNFIQVHNPNDDVNITEVDLSRRAPH